MCSPNRPKSEDLKLETVISNRKAAAMNYRSSQWSFLPFHKLLGGVRIDSALLLLPQGTLCLQ